MEENWFYMHMCTILTFLASLLSCMRTIHLMLCSADGVALPAPQLSRTTVPADGGSSLGLSCAQKLYSWETHYPAPLTLQLLMASCGLSSLSHLDSLYQHSHYNVNLVYGTTQLKLRGDWHFTPLQKKVSCKSPTSAELCQSCSFSCLSSSPNQLASSLPLSWKCCNIASISLLSQMRFLSSLLK